MPPVIVSLGRLQLQLAHEIRQLLLPPAPVMVDVEAPVVEPGGYGLLAADGVEGAGTG